jgi:carbon monoxide dehydrogenase subunit G
LVKAHTILEGKMAGEVRTLLLKKMTVLHKMNYNGTSSTISWSFKDTEGGTKVTWQSKGNMSFLLKSTLL